MEKIVDGFCRGAADAFDGFQVRKSCAGDAVCGTEPVQQGPFAFAANARDIVQLRALQAFRPFRPMSADGEPVRLVAKPLQEVKHRVVFVQPDRCGAVREVEFFLACIPVGTLGDADQRHVVDPEFFENFQGDPELPFAAVDQHQVWP